MDEDVMCDVSAISSLSVGREWCLLKISDPTRTFNLNLNGYFTRARGPRFRRESGRRRVGGPL
jgi:hypothetical protein